MSVQFSQPCVATGHTSAFISRNFVEIGMLWLYHIFCSDATIACPLFNLVGNSVVHSPSFLISDPRYGNVSTCSNWSLWMSKQELWRCDLLSDGWHVQSLNEVVEAVAGASIPPTGHGAFPLPTPRWPDGFPPIFDYNEPDTRQSYHF